MQSIKTFIIQSIKNFIRTGAILPSTNRLAKRMTRGVKGPVILELGPGTGVFTKEILKILPENGVLISIESNEAFVKHLNEKIKDKRLIVCNGDASLLGKFLKENKIEKVDYVISGLPLGHFKKELKQKILTEINKNLKHGGEYIQFQYFLADIKTIKSFFPKTKISFELFNVPPAFVIRCKKI